jgi:hypothetical protein
MKLMAELRARAARSDRTDRGAAALDLSLGAVLLGVTLVAAITLFGASW